MRMLNYCVILKKKTFFSLFSNSFEINQTDSAPKNAPTLCRLTNLCGRYITLKLMVSPPSDSRHLLVLFLSSLRPAAMCVTSRRSSTPSLSATCRSMWTRSSGCSRSAAASVTTLVWRRPTWRTTLVPDTQVRSPWRSDDWQSTRLRKSAECLSAETQFGILICFFLHETVHFFAAFKQEAVFFKFIFLFYFLISFP